MSHNWNNFRSKRLDDPLYRVWASMKQRCLNKKSEAYSNYGGRGILICDRWLKFDNFSEDMRASYKEGLTLERIDNNGNYEPSNCKWVTRTDQANNRRSSRYFTIDGQIKTFAEWIKLSRIKSSTVRQRFYVYGWSIEKSLGKRGK